MLRRRGYTNNPALSIWFALLTFAAAIFSIVLYLFLRQTEVPVMVDSLEWVRVIHIQEYRTVREGSWILPSGSRNVSSERRVHHYEQVLAGYNTRTETYTVGGETRTRTVRDPYYRSEPVYRDWYKYDIDRWVDSRQVKTSAKNRSDPSPYWGEFSLRCQATEIGCERVRGRSEEYIVLFKDDEGKTYSYKDSQSDWEQYEYAGQYILRINGLGIQNDPLRPEEKK